MLIFENNIWTDTIDNFIIKKSLDVVCEIIFSHEIKILKNILTNDDVLNKSHEGYKLLEQVKKYETNLKNNQVHTDHTFYDQF